MSQDNWSMSVVIPTILEEDKRGNRVPYDIFSRLLKDRIVFLHGTITQESAANVIAQLLYLEKEDHKTPVQLFIMSPGGAIQPGMAIIDTMHHIKPPVYTVGIGQIASMASIIAAAGEWGHRYLLPHTSVMIHQPWINGLDRVNTSELVATAQMLDRLKEEIIRMLAKYTENTITAIRKAIEVDKWMTAQEAIDFGLADEIIYKNKRYAR